MVWVLLLLFSLLWASFWCLGRANVPVQWSMLRWTFLGTICSIFLISWEKWEKRGEEWRGGPLLCLGQGTLYRWKAQLYIRAHSVALEDVEGGNVSARFPSSVRGSVLLLSRMGIYSNNTFCKLWVLVFRLYLPCTVLLKGAECSKSGHWGKINEIQMFGGLIINLKQGGFYCHS